MGRAPCCDKANVKKGPWSPEEDAKLKSYIHQHGTGGNWIALPQKIGLKRCGKSCRLRWLNYLRPNIKHGGFSEEEDNIICSLYISIGSRWSIIAAQLPGRTDNDIKNYWNTRLKKKLLGKHRKDKQRACRVRHTTSDHVVVEPLPPPPPPVLPYSDVVQDPRFNDCASIRSLLLKLGGRFDQTEYANEIKIIDQYDDHLLHPISYNHSMPLIDHTSTTSLLTAAPHFDHTLVGSPYGDPHKMEQGGLEFLCDDFVASASDDMTMEMLTASLIFASNNQGFVQGSSMEEVAAVHDKMRYHGN